MNGLFGKNEEIAKVLKESYVLVHVNRNKERNAEVNVRYGNPSRHGYPVLVFLDGEGTLLRVQETGSLEKGKEHDPDKVLSLLKAWAPGSASALLPFDEKADARKELERAKEAAARDGRLLLLHFGRNESEWCRRLGRLLREDREIAEVLGKGFVLVPVDRKTSDKHRDLDEAFDGPSLLGYPVLVVADAAGKALHTQSTADFEEGEAYDREAVLRFLKEWEAKRGRK